MYTNQLHGISAVVVANDCIKVSGPGTYKHRLWLGHKHKGHGRYNSQSRSWYLPVDRKDILISYFTLTEQQR